MCHNAVGAGGALSQGKFAPNLWETTPTPPLRGDADRPAVDARVQRREHHARGEARHHRVHRPAGRRVPGRSRPSAPSAPSARASGPGSSAWACSSAQQSGSERSPREHPRTRPRGHDEIPTHADGHAARPVRGPGPPGAPRPPGRPRPEGEQEGRAPGRLPLRHLGHRRRSASWSRTSRCRRARPSSRCALEPRPRHRARALAAGHRLRGGPLGQGADERPREVRGAPPRSAATTTRATPPSRCSRKAPPTRRIGRRGAAPGRA